MISYPLRYIQSQKRPLAKRVSNWHTTTSLPFLIARFMGPTWGPPGADRTQVGPMLAPWTLLSGLLSIRGNYHELGSDQTTYSLWPRYVTAYIYDYVLYRNVITLPCTACNTYFRWTAIEIKAWMDNYKPQKTMVDRYFYAHKDKTSICTRFLALYVVLGIIKFLSSTLWNHTGRMQPSVCQIWM